MKIKKKNKVQKKNLDRNFPNNLGLFTDGGGLQLNPTDSNMNWGNNLQYTAPTTNQIYQNSSSGMVSDTSNTGWNNMNTLPKNNNQFGRNMLSNLPALGTTLGAINNSDQPAFNKTSQSFNAIGDTAASSIPGFGQFYGAVRGVSSAIQGAIPGNSITDPKTGISYTKKDTKAGQTINTWLEPAHTQAATSWAKAAASKSSADKARYAFEGIGDLFGLTSIPKMIANGTGNDEDSKMYNKLKGAQDAESYRRLHPDVSTFANGGTLEQYNLPPHAMQNPNVPNTTLDGQPVQIDKNETIFRNSNKDYVFSDTLKNKETGNTFAEDSKKVDSRYKRPYYDPISLATKDKELNSLTVKNDLAKQMQEMKAFVKQFKFGGGIDKYANGGTDGDYTQLAGMLPATMYNTAMSFMPADKEKPLYNPYQDTIKDIYSNRQFNEQPLLNESQMAFNTAKSDIDNNSLSDSVRRANLVALSSNLARQNQSMRLQGQQLNNGYRAEQGNILNNLGEQKVLEDRRVSDINAQNKGRKQMFGSIAASQVGQGLTEYGKSKNQNLSNELGYTALQNIFANFGLSGNDLNEFLQTKGIKFKDNKVKK